MVLKINFCLLFQWPLKTGFTVIIWKPTKWIIHLLVVMYKCHTRHGMKVTLHGWPILCFIYWATSLENKSTRFVSWKLNLTCSATNTSLNSKRICHEISPNRSQWVDLKICQEQNFWGSSICKIKVKAEFDQCKYWWPTTTYTGRALDHLHNLITDQSNLSLYKDFPTFLKLGPGACLIWGKKHLDHQIGKTRTGQPF